VREPVSLFVAFSEALHRGELPDDEARRWWLTGTRRALARGERLDQGLGLAQAGRWMLRQRIAKLARDAHLVDAAAGITLDPRATVYQRALRLSEQVEAFLADDWPTARTLSVPPADWAPWHVHLWHAARCDLGLPCDVRHLMRLLAEPPGYERQSFDADHLAHLLMTACEPSTSPD
jgi:hypothetical protein